MTFDEKAVREVARWVQDMHQGVIAEAARIAQEDGRNRVTQEDVDKAISACMAGMAG
jgi:histone H3/H4